MKRRTPKSNAAVVRILGRAENHAYSSILLNDLIKNNQVDPRELSLMQKTIRGVLENRAYLDALLDPLLKKGLDSVPADIRNCLRAGAYQILFLDRLPDQVAVDRTVEMSKQVTKNPFLVKLVNAVLRRVVRERPEPVIPALKEDPLEHITVLYSHPRWLVSRWIDQFGVEETLALCQANNQEFPVCLRVNTLRLEASQLQEVLAGEGVLTKPSKFMDQCLLVEELPAGRRLDQLDAFLRGEFIVQDQSSALVGLLVEAKPGETIIDLCSAPGGKTTHVAAQMNNQGRVIALDLHASRLRLIKANCGRLGIDIVETREGDGAIFSYDSLVDAVLVDAPCSGSGVLGRKSDARWSKDKRILNELPPQQSALLDNAAGLVRSGGRIIYSTCSIERVENEEIITKFLREHLDFQLGNISHLIPEGLSTAEGYLRTWPHLHQMDGIFAACLLKK